MTSLRQTQRSQTLTISSFRGLANRLRVLLSGIALAEASGRTLRMLWPRTRDCASDFYELFATPAFAGELVPQVQILSVSLEQALALPSRSFHQPSGIPDFLQDTSLDISLEYVSWLIAPERYPQHVQLIKRCEALFLALTPHPSIRARIDQFQRNQFRPSMIGVHLRRGDQLRVYPQSVGNTQEAMRAVDSFLEQCPDAGILLCSDDGAVDQLTGVQSREGIRELFTTRYGARVVWNDPRSLDRRVPAASEDALLDLFLLRSCDFIVGSGSSSFSQLAHFGREIPFVYCEAPLHTGILTRVRDGYTSAISLARTRWRKYSLEPFSQKRYEGRRKRWEIPR